MRTPWHHNMSCGGTIWSPQYGWGEAIWQRRAAACATTPQSRKSEQSRRSLHTRAFDREKEKYGSWFFGTIAQPNRAQSAWTKQAGWGRHDLQTSSPHSWKRLHNKMCCAQFLSQIWHIRTQMWSQILLQPERLHRDWCFTKLILSHNSWGD